MPEDTDDNRIYEMIWSSSDGFAVWVSTDGQMIQFTDPEGEVVASKPRPKKTHD